MQLSDARRNVKRTLHTKHKHTHIHAHAYTYIHTARHTHTYIYRKSHYALCTVCLWCMDRNEHIQRKSHYALCTHTYTENHTMPCAHTHTPKITLCPMHTHIHRKSHYALCTHTYTGNHTMPCAPCAYDAWIGMNHNCVFMNHEWWRSGKFCAAWNKEYTPRKHLQLY